MRRICSLPYGLELWVDTADCSPFFRRGRRYMCRPHERTDPAEMRRIADTLKVEEKARRRDGDSLAVVCIVNARAVVDSEMRRRLEAAPAVNI